MLISIIQMKRVLKMQQYARVKMIVLFAAILCFGISPAWGANLYVDASA